MEKDGSEKAIKRLLSLDFTDHAGMIYEISKKLELKIDRLAERLKLDELMFAL